MGFLQELARKVSENIPNPDDLIERLGVRYVPEPLSFERGPDVTTLDVPGYRQTQSYTCGFTSGLSVLHTFHPNKSDAAFLRRVAPHPKNGTPDSRLIRALRQRGVGVSVRTSLDFDGLWETVDAGHPIIVTVKVEDPADHWCVLYGVRRRPHRSVFLAGNGFFKRKEMPWAKFRKSVWTPAGNGLVCWGK